MTVAGALVISTHCDLETHVYAFTRVEQYFQTNLYVSKCNLTSCHSVLEQRDDDGEEIVRNRLEVYQEKTKPLTLHYQKQGSKDCRRGKRYRILQPVNSV
jgi:adenylate kinase family enzyme